MTDSKENSTDDNAPTSEPENQNQVEVTNDPPAEKAAGGDESSSSDSGKGRGRSRGKRSEGDSANSDQAKGTGDSDSDSKKDADDRSSNSDSRDQGGGNNRSNGGGGGGRSRSRRKPKAVAKQGRDNTVKLDAKEWQGKAWELYLADIREEGTAMFDDQEARKLAKRSFDLAAIFMQTREQIVGPMGKKKKAKGKPDAAETDNQNASQNVDE